MAADNDDNAQPCAKCRLRTLVTQLRASLDGNLPLCRDCYARLNELTAHYKRHPVIPYSLVQEAREEIHRLNVMKVRYEDLVEALERGQTRLSLKELDEMKGLMKVFDNANTDMKEILETKFGLRKREDERMRGKRNGMITRLDGLTISDEAEAEGNKRTQVGYDYWNAPQGDFI